MGGAGGGETELVNHFENHRVSSEQGGEPSLLLWEEAGKTFQAQKAARTWRSAPFQPGTPAPILGHG